MKKLKLPIIKGDMVSPILKDFDHALKSIQLSFDIFPVDLSDVRHQKDQIRFDEPFRIKPVKKAA